MAWPTMPSVALPVVKYTVSITDSNLTAAFSFRVAKQPIGGSQLASFGASYDRMALTFLVTDLTNHSAVGSPGLVFGSNFTGVLIKALRKLVFESGSIIPKPGDFLSMGATKLSVVDTVDIAQVNPQTTDAFLVTCSIKEPSTNATVIGDDETPRLSKSDELPPWQMPADVTYEAKTVEGMTLGFAFPTSDLDGAKTYTNDELRKRAVATSNKRVAVENYAKDPFSSPPAMPGVAGTLRVTRAFLRGGGTVDLSELQGSVNDNAIAISLTGAKLYFPAGTLAPEHVHMTPKVWKKPIPWYPKTKHPLNKTYGELFYGYSRQTANKIAINKTNQILIVYKPLRYLEASASFTFMPAGFGVWIANRGYTELDSSVAGGRRPIYNSDTSAIKESWLTKEGKRTDNERRWRGFTQRAPSGNVEKLLQQFFTEVSGDISWASEKDNFGESVL